MKWFKCKNCGSKRVHLTSENKRTICSECHEKHYTKDVVWYMWCCDCDKWTTGHNSPMEAFEAWEGKEVKDLSEVF